VCFYVYGSGQRRWKKLADRKWDFEWNKLGFELKNIFGPFMVDVMNIVMVLGDNWKIEEGDDFGDLVWNVVKLCVKSEWIKDGWGG
jgi:hypothetical protein